MTACREGFQNATDVAAELKVRIGELAETLLGKPNRALSTKKQLRFGKQGSKAVDIAGENAGLWFDHEANVGGSGLELIKHVRNVDLGAALDWARIWLGWPAYVAAGSWFHSGAGSADQPVDDAEAPGQFQVRRARRSR